MEAQRLREICKSGFGPDEKNPLFVLSPGLRVLAVSAVYLSDHGRFVVVNAFGERMTVYPEIVFESRLEAVETSIVIAAWMQANLESSRIEFKDVYIGQIAFKALIDKKPMMARDSETVDLESAPAEPSATPNDVTRNIRAEKPAIDPVSKMLWEYVKQSPPNLSAEMADLVDSVNKAAGK